MTSLIKVIEPFVKKIKTFCEWIKINIHRLVRSVECELQNIGAAIQS